MWTTEQTLKGYNLQSLDGKIGTVKEFYFDDQYWTIRYLVADAGSWLMGWKVLISPYALLGVDKEEETISIDLTKKQIEECPPLESDQTRFQTIRGGILRILWMAVVLGRAIHVGRFFPN